LSKAGSDDVDLASHDDLRRAWADHAERLLEMKLASSLESAISLIEPKSLDAAR
jgi:hypothetical protein